MIVAMGLKDRIVGVSAWEADPELKKRPVVGDYERVDWEKLSELRPGFLVVQGRVERLPPGLKQRSDQLGIELVDLQIDRLGDIDLAVKRLGSVLNESNAADAFVQAQRRRLSKYDNVAPNQAVPALIVHSENGKSVAGRDNFLDDVLQLAGGVNVIEAKGYVTLDQEKLLTLRPTVVFILMPGASEATVAAAIQSVKSVDTMPAVKDNRIIAITRADALLPASATPELVREFYEQLHPARSP